MLNQSNSYIELNIIKEENGKRITLVKDIETNILYIKKELSHYNVNLWSTLQQLNLDSIPAIYSLEEKNQELIVIEEYLNCPTLDTVVSTQQLSKTEVREIILQLSKTLKILHSLNPPIIHRDIKPSNVFYDGKHVYLSDFDIARVYNDASNKDTVLLGSKGYAAPEHYGFGQTDQRSDIYSLGVLYNYLLTGKLRDEYLADSEERILIASMTDYSIDQRIQTMEEVEEEVTQLLKNNKLPQPTNKYTLPGFRNKNTTHMIIASLLYAFILLISVSVKANNSGYIEAIVDKFFILSWFVIITIYSTNYLDIHTKCLFSNSNNKYLRIFGIALTAFLVWCLDCFIFVIVYNLVV